jgi:siderophore synthetase component
VSVPATDEAAQDRARRDLLGRVIECLLREDFAGLRRDGAEVVRLDGPWWESVVAGRPVAVPVRTGTGPWDLALRAPLALTGDQRVADLDQLLAWMASVTDPEDAPGIGAFRQECADAVLATALAETGRPAAIDTWLGRLGPAAGWTGLAGAVGYDMLAAHLPHPVYPTAAARSGLAAADHLRFGPEHAAEFALHWLAVPRGAAGATWPVPGWPTPADVGLPDLTGSHLMLPVHPLSVDALVPQALAGLGIEGAVPARRRALVVRATLSVRTVALVSHPRVHLKLPIPTATLGARNRRTIKPGTLTDGHLAQLVLGAVLGREPELAATVLLADESRYVEPGHEGLAVLVRRYPPDLESCCVVPLAALAAAGTGGPPVVDELAARFTGHDVRHLYRLLARTLLRCSTVLFGYGIALEAHQQNVSLVLDRADGGDRATADTPRLRLLLKDNDGLRVHGRRARSRLGADAGLLARFADHRVVVQDDRPLTDLLITVTIHLGLGAVAFAAARRLGEPVAGWLDVLRDELRDAVDALGAGQPACAATLTRDVLEAPRWPVKAMLTAGTLLSKQRSGARDINKHYTDGPNYLLPGAR